MPKPQHQQVLVAFYHSEYTPTKLPSVAHLPARRAEIRQALPERPASTSPGTRPTAATSRAFSSPSASGAAQYYRALMRVCKGCTVIGLDVLDQANITPTLRLHLRIQARDRPPGTVMPSIWGLHNYSDVNRLQSWRTHELVRALGGQVWITETGGIVQVRPANSRTTRLRADPLGEGPQVHVRRRRLGAADQAPVHL